MAITDYGTLKTAVANYLHRDDLTANIPDFINMAEWKIARALRVSQLLATGLVTIAAGDSSGALPTGFMELVNCKITGGSELHYVPPDRLDQVSGSGTPWVYSLVGSAITVAPIWADGGTLTVTYWKKETALSDSATTNWYVANAPDALLYGALLECSPYIKDDSRVAVWQAFFTQAISALNAQYGNVDPHKRAQAYAMPGVNASSDLRNSA